MDPVTVGLLIFAAAAVGMMVGYFVGHHMAQEEMKPFLKSVKEGWTKLV